MNNDSLGDFFGYVSKAVIIVPIVIIVLSLLMKFNQNSQPREISPTATLTPTPTTANKINFDLDGPWTCHYKNGNQEYDLSIKNKKISLEIKTSGQTKTYDLSQYAGLLESFKNLDIGQLESFTKPYLPKGVDLKSILNSCKKGE